ncbi:MAG: hypothetical protein NTX45_15845 [Proteobacteria bacterium]|nr:hypothetical protein [Pseudomonadota bacterium]
MKSLISVVFALLIGWCSSAVADQAYGTFKILGIGSQLADSYLVVFASYVGGGYQPQTCAQPDWWWPAGTTHAWWFDRNDMTTFAVMLSAAKAKSNVFIQGFPDLKPFGLGVKCRINSYANR